jgi:hypothetical protein
LEPAILRVNLDMRAIVERHADAGGGFPIAVRVIESGDGQVVRVALQPTATQEQTIIE